jgi:hypothetical protein
MQDRPNHKDSAYRVATRTKVGGAIRTKVGDALRNQFLVTASLPDPIIKLLGALDEGECDHPSETKNPA